LIYRSSEFQFAKDMLGRVNERYVDLTIQKEDVQFIVKQRLLLKNEHQREQIRQHLSRFVAMFPNMNNNLDLYVNLFPVHPSYFENFSLIRIGKSQREVLKTLSHKFSSIMDDDVPTDNPGLICYDSYWQDMQNNVDLKADPDVNKVSTITELVDQKIEDNFTRGLAPKKLLAHRIVSAAAIKILQTDLSHPNGVTAESLANDLCYIDPTCDIYDDLVDLAFTHTLDSIVSATIGQYFEKGENNEYHLRIEGGVNYEQKVKDYASQMGDSQKDEYFYMFLAEVLPVEGNTYRTNFRIWEHHIAWQTHKCERTGYIFMGNPNERSTTQPQQHFYIYFMPIFDNTAKKHTNEIDSVFFLMDDLSDELKQMITLYGSAVSQEGSSSSDEKPRYRLLHEKYYKEARDLFNKQFLSKTIVEYMGEKHPMQGMPGATAESKIDAVSAITSYIMEPQFESENSYYPKFTALNQLLTHSNWDNLLSSARKKIANTVVVNTTGEAILMGLGLWEDGHLSTIHSQYARSLKSKLDAKGGQVLNRNEILEVFFADTNTYISSDFHIEADLEMLVMFVMAALGEIEIVLKGGSRVNAGNITDITNLSSQDSYLFSYICPPKGINIPLVRVLMKGILGADRTNELDDPNSSVFAELMAKSQTMESEIVMLQHQIQNGYSIAGDIEVITADYAREMNIELTSLKGICNQMQRYNTKAKMRNIPWTMDIVEKAMTETLQKVYTTEKMLKELDKFKSLIAYLRTALTNVNDTELKETITAGIDKIKDVIGQGDAATKAYQAELNALKEQYADWYMDKYLKAHISEIDSGKKQKLMSCEHKIVCDDIHDATFINPAPYDAWLKEMASMKVAYPNVDKQAILSMPTSVDGFNPTLQTGSLPKLGDMKDKLDGIYADYEAQFHEAMEDPTTKKNRDLLSDEEKTMLQQFLDGTITLNHQYAHPLIEIITKLQKSFSRVEIDETVMKQIFKKPMNKQQALKAFEDYIDSQSVGRRPEDVRIIIK
jgi:hypothetical protein